MTSRTSHRKVPSISPSRRSIFASITVDVARVTSTARIRKSMDRFHSSSDTYQATASTSVHVSESYLPPVPNSASNWASRRAETVAHVRPLTVRSSIIIE